MPSCSVRRSLGRHHRHGADLGARHAPGHRCWPLCWPPGSSRPGSAHAWVTGLATPLFVDGWVVIAHTLGAALVAGAVLAVLGVASPAGGRPAPVDRRDELAVLLRNEVLLLGVVLVLATGVVGADPPLAGASAVVVAAVAAAGAALLGNTVVDALRGVTGGIARGGSAGVGGAGFVAGRLSSAFITLLMPSYGSLGVDDIVTLVAVVLVGRGGGHRPPPAGRPGGHPPVRRPGHGGSRGPGGHDAGGHAGARWSRPRSSPQALGALTLAVRQDAERRWSASTVALFAAAVLATQYATGGSGEWGGRYFALSLPLLVPLLVIGLGRSHRPRPLDQTARGRRPGGLGARLRLGGGPEPHEDRGRHRGARGRGPGRPRSDSMTRWSLAAGGAAARFSWREVLHRPASGCSRPPTTCRRWLERARRRWSRRGSWPHGRPSRTEGRWRAGPPSATSRSGGVPPGPSSPFRRGETSTRSKHVFGLGGADRVGPWPISW